MKSYYCYTVWYKYNDSKNQDVLLSSLRSHFICSFIREIFIICSKVASFPLRFRIFSFSWMKTQNSDSSHESICKVNTLNPAFSSDLFPLWSICSILWLEVIRDSCELINFLDQNHNNGRTWNSWIYLFVTSRSVFCFYKTAIFALLPVLLLSDSTQSSSGVICDLIIGYLDYIYNLLLS